MKRLCSWSGGAAIDRFSQDMTRVKGHKMKSELSQLATHELSVVTRLQSVMTFSECLPTYFGLSRQPTWKVSVLGWFG